MTANAAWTSYGVVKLKAHHVLLRNVFISCTIFELYFRLLLMWKIDSECSVWLRLAYGKSMPVFSLLLISSGCEYISFAPVCLPTYYTSLLTRMFIADLSYTHLDVYRHWMCGSRALLENLLCENREKMFHSNRPDDRHTHTYMNSMHHSNEAFVQSTGNQ